MTGQGTNAASAVGPGAGRRAPILYISYDGMSEPLGRSQVLGYLTRLAAEFQITLISFEKEQDGIPALRSALSDAGINWMPQRYHRRPPVLSTLLDVLRARTAIRGTNEEYTLVHARSYVPALMALLAGRKVWQRLLFDIRGFWADERVEGGIWPAGGWLYKLAKRCERWFFAEADAVVTLTEASLPQIRTLLGRREIPVVVIPTCVDLDAFADNPARSDGPQLVWSGSIGTWYRFDLVAPLARELGIPLTVVTRQRQEAVEALDGLTATVVSRRPEEIPGELFAGDIGLCLIKASFSKIASAPTRLGEYLAAGMPVLVTPVGDLEALVENNGVGVVVRSEDASGLGAAAQAVRRLAADPAVSARCRAVARQRFDVREGAARYSELYRELLSVSRPAR